MLESNYNNAYKIAKSHPNSVSARAMRNVSIRDVTKAQLEKIKQSTNRKLLAKLRKKPKKYKPKIASNGRKIKNVTYYKNKYKYSTIRGRIPRIIALNRARHHARYITRKRRSRTYRTSKTKLTTLTNRLTQKRALLAHTRVGSRKNASLTRQITRLNNQITNRRRITQNKRIPNESD